MKLPILLAITLCPLFAARAQTPMPTPPQCSVLDLGTLYGGGSGANAVNNSGDVAGYAANNGTADNRAFLYSGGSMVDIGTLAGGNTYANAINNLGDVVGDSNTTSGGNAFLYSNGRMSNLGILGNAFGINDSGQIVGLFSYGNGYAHAFLYSSGTMTDQGTLGGNSSWAYGINTAGQIAGRADTAAGETHAFFYSNGNTMDLGTFGGRTSVAEAINNSGQVVGYAYFAGDSSAHAFLYSNGAMQDLGVLGGPPYSDAHALNGSGQVVGRSYVSNGTQHAFLYSNSVMYDLNDLCAGSGAFLVDAGGINDLGQIAATGNPAQGGDAHAFLLRPISSATTGTTVSSSVPANSSYVTVAPVTNSSSPNNTTASLIGGSATGNSTVNITFTDGSSLSGFQAASDVVQVSGTGSDIIVLQLSYNAADAIRMFGSEANARLTWLDPSDNQWKLAISGNTGGTPQFVAGAYDPAKDFHLGYYGVDTVNKVVWAVINHNSVFTTGNSAAVTPPAIADLRVTVTNKTNGVVAGAKTTYTIVVRNAGPDAVTGPVMTDTFPSLFTGVTFSATQTGGATGFTTTGSGNIYDTVTMPAGSTINYKAFGKVSSSASGTLSNTATVSAPSGTTDTSLANNSATDTDAITLKSDLKVTVNDGKTTAVAGTKNTYTITLTNVGPSDVAGASLTDAFPNSFTGVAYTATATGGATGFMASGIGDINDTVTLPSKGKITYKAKGTISPTVTGSISDTASASVPSGVTDPKPTNNSATDTDTL